jgi:CHAT domain-containing protein
MRWLLLVLRWFLRPKRNTKKGVIYNLKFYVRLPARYIFPLGLCSLFGLLLVSHSQGSAIYRGQDEHSLELERPIEREIAGGESHSYRILLTSSQFLQVEIGPREIEMQVSLLAPDGKSLAEVAIPKRQWPELISMVAETAGEYRLRIRSVEKDAVRRRYAVKATGLRTATAQDRRYVAAEQSLRDGERLSQQETKEYFRQAIEKYKDALPVWREAGDKLREAHTLSLTGWAYFEIDKNGALNYFKQALPLWRELHNRRKEAETLSAVGLLLVMSLQPREAIEYLQQSLTLDRELGDRPSEAAMLAMLGGAYLLIEPQKALEYLTQARVIFKELKDTEAEAKVLGGIGVAYLAIGKKETAAEYFEQSRQLSQNLQKKRREIISTTTDQAYLEGIQLVVQGSAELLPQAIKKLEEALKGWRTLNEPAMVANTLNVIGFAHLELRDYQSSLAALQQALESWRAEGIVFGETAALMLMGKCHLSLGKFREALGSFQQGLRVSQAGGDFAGEAITRFCIARAEDSLGNLPEAFSQIKEAINLIEKYRIGIASPEWRASYFDLKQDYYEFGIDLLLRLHHLHPAEGYDALALQVSERARARSLLELLSEYKEAIRPGIDSALIERERALHQRLNEQALSVLRLAAKPGAAVRISADKKEAEALTIELEQVKAEIRRKNPRYANLTQPPTLSLLEIQSSVLDYETALLEYALGEERSHLWLVTRSSISCYELPKRAEIEATAISIYNHLTERTREKKGEDIQQMGARIDVADAKYRQESASLSQTLLGKVAGQLTTKRLVIVADGALQYMPFGALPLPAGMRASSNSITACKSAKRNGGPTPLLCRFEIVNLPSASTLVVLRNEMADRKPAPKALAVLADPVFEENDDRFNESADGAKQRSTDRSGRTVTAPPRKGEKAVSAFMSDLITARGFNFNRLPGTKTQAEYISAMIPASEVFRALGFEANREAAVSDRLSQYRIIHFATHALADSERPELSTIVLSLFDQQRHPQDGFLRAHEVYNLNLPADLVVLSGCETGWGKLVKGEGLISLTRAFMYAGAPRVVASLWEVSDEATAELMKRFYKKMLKEGLRPAAALRKAQVEMWRQPQWRAPYYWAGFVIQGEWRDGKDSSAAH